MMHFNPTSLDNALIVYVTDGNIDYIKLLLQKPGANVNVQDPYGASLALLAAKRNDLNMLKVLVEAGADLKISDGVGLTPLAWAEHHKNNEMVNFINSKNGSSLKP